MKIWFRHPVLKRHQKINNKKFKKKRNPCGSIKYPQGFLVYKAEEKEDDANISHKIAENVKKHSLKMAENKQMKSIN